MRAVRAIVVVALVASLVVGAPVAVACGPWFPTAVFVNESHPDRPYEAYVRGRLGILQEGYWRENLIVAYRVLNGRAFTEAEVGVLMGKTGERQAENIDWIESWEELRDRIAGKRVEGRLISYGRPGIEVFRQRGNEYQAYINCLLPAFQTAVETLEARVKEFGAESNGVQDWVRAQDMVFKNCDSGGNEQKAVQLPAEATAAMPAKLRADRAYQIAAAHFYAGDFEQARKRFQMIAADKESPWRVVAPLLAARCLIRQGTLDAVNATTRRARFGEAEAELRRVLADAGQREYHASARRLFGFVEFRLRPMERTVELARRLEKPGDVKSLRQDLTDYTRLLDRFAGDDPSESAVGPRAERLAARWKESQELRKQDDLTDWVLTFQVGTPEALAHAVDRWKVTKSVAWLAAAMTKMPPGHAGEAEVTAAGARVDAQAPAYVMLRFHGLRLLAGKGEVVAARAGYEEMLRLPVSRLTASGRNLVLAYRMKLATDLRDMLRYAPREATAVGYGAGMETSKEKATWLDVDGAAMLNKRMPTAQLVAAVKLHVLPANLNRELVRAAWVRAYLLGEEGDAAELARLLGDESAELRKLTEEYRKATVGESRQFAGAVLLLKYPGLRPFVTAGGPRETPLENIDSYRENWWGSFKPIGVDEQFYFRQNMTYEAMEETTETSGDSCRTTGSLKPTFLSEAENREAEKERERLREIPTAPNFLAGVVIRWAKANPGDARVPEALHLVVRATRYGQGDKQTTGWSKQAFQVLHQKYPKSEWAKETKYWY